MIIDEEIILNFVDAICDIMEIDDVTIKYVDQLFTSTIKAAYFPEDNTIAIAKHNTDKFFLLFSIAHELRHAYQNQKGLLKDQVSSVMLNPDKYNEQENEVDANAFAKVVMGLVFGLKPSNKINNTPKVNAREKELLYKYGKTILEAFEIN